MVDINKLEDIATLDKLKDGAEEVLRQLPGMIEHPPQGMDAESLKALARGYQEVLKTIDARIDAVDVMGQSGSFTHDVGSVGGTGAEMIHDASGEHLGTYETPDGLRVDFQYNPNGEISGINFKGFMRGEVQSLNPDFEQNIQQAIQSGKLKPSEYAVAADKIRTDGRTVDLYRKVIDSMEKGGKGSTPEAEALREHIERIIESAEKRYGDVFKG